MSRPATADPYAHPGFAPVSGEVSGVDLRIEGDLPAELDGVFLRNGANALFPPRHRHMFDGEAMVHMVEIRGGAARYSNALVRTPRTRWIEKAGRNPFIGVADLVGGHKSTLLRLVTDKWKISLGMLPRFSPIETGSNSTAILHHDNRLYALQETSLPFRLDVTRGADGWLRMDGNGTFETFDGHLTFPFSAHPKTDPRTGDVHSIVVDIMTGIVRHTLVEPGGAPTGAGRSTVVMRGKPPPFFIHDYVLTGDVVVFPDSSLRFDPAALVKAGSVARFDTDHKLRFGVIPRDPADDGQVRWFETSFPGHIWHIANGWQAADERGDAIHLYAPVFRDYPASIPIHTPAETHTQFVHWRLDLATGTVEERVLLDHHYERPGIDWRQHGRPSRYTYLLDESSGVMGKGVLKYDLFDERAVGYVDYGDLLGGEPVFVPRGEGAAEDDGWVLDLLADGERAALIVTDAVTMVERCRIHLPRRVPFGVHALWLDRATTDGLETLKEGA